MQQLSGLDATFLYIETAEMPMHVGALHVFALPTGSRGSFVIALRRHVAQRLPALPVLRRRLWWMPLNLANPAWVDADPDLVQHIVSHRLPPEARHGDGLPTLRAAVSQLHPQLLDRRRPLWKFHVLEGLAPAADGRRRVGLYTQLHHAAVDGQAAVALAHTLLDLGPVPRSLGAPADAAPRVFKLDMTEMLRGVLGGQAQKVADIVRQLPGTVGTLKGAASQALAASRLLRTAGGAGAVADDQPSPRRGGNVTLAPRTVLNGSVTAARAFASVSLPLAALKATSRAQGATLNDTVLMLCSSALRRYFAKRRTLPRKSLVAAVPISLRAKGDTRADNQASMSLISLGTHVADARQRLAHIKAASAAMKQTMGSVKSVLPTDFPSLGMPWLIEAASALYGRARVADRLPLVANLVISNVPGPAVPLYLAGAQMLSNHPASIVVHGLALNITVQSYDQSLEFGLMADAAAMPDVQELADAISIAFDDLQALPPEGQPDSDDPLPPGMLNRAARNAAGRVARGVGGVGSAVGGAVGGAVGRAVGGAVSSAVSAAVTQAVKTSLRSARGQAPDASPAPDATARASRRKSLPAVPPGPVPTPAPPPTTARARQRAAARRATDV